MQSIKLASGSPRRKEILETFHIKFEQIPHHFDETSLHPDEYANKVDYVKKLAYLKALSAKGDIEKNCVKDIYRPFTPEQISKKMSEMLLGDESKVKLQIIFQKIENLHKSCPNHKGDWYFTGDYPTVGGNKVVNQAFINFVENKKGRAY